jgi:hypothetical protein
LEQARQHRQKAGEKAADGGSRHGWAHEGKNPDFQEDHVWIPPQAGNINGTETSGPGWARPTPPAIRQRLSAIRRADPSIGAKVMFDKSWKMYFIEWVG